MRVDRVVRARRRAGAASRPSAPRPRRDRIARAAGRAPGERARAGRRPRSASTTDWTGIDLCDPASPLRLEAAPAGEAAAGRPGDAADRDRLRRRAVDDASVAARRGRASVGLRPAIGTLSADDGRWTSARSACSSSRPSGRASRRPRRSRRRAAWPRRSSRRATRSSSRAASTRPTRRARLLEERPGVGIGAAHDIGPAIERAARGGRLEPAQFLEIAETLDATARLATVARRRAAAAAARARARAAPAAGAAQHARAQLRPGRASCSTRPRRASAACGRPSGSPTTGCAAGSTRSSARSSAARSRSRSSRSATGATSCRSRPRRARGSRASSTTRRAAARRCSSSRSSSSSSATPGARRRSPRPRRSPGSSTSCRRSWRPTRTALRETLDALARFDLWAAKAPLAAEMDGIRAETADRPEVVLLSARHPGLTGRVVPIDIRLGDGYTALVVTGPNTGGKTVTLRTLGLLSLMHQAGLHVPAAAGSRLPVWRDVFADIGDEQSIAQSLSTFSGHLRSIIRIVEAAGPGHARPARRARRRHRPDRGLGARPGAPRPLHPGRGARRGDDALRRAQGLRPHDAGRPQRRGRVRPRDARRRPTA